MEENFNIHLGKKLRMRRLSLSLTQTKLHKPLTLHFSRFKNTKRELMELAQIDLCNYLNF